MAYSLRLLRFAERKLCICKKRRIGSNKTNPQGLSFKTIGVFKELFKSQQVINIPIGSNPEVGEVETIMFFRHFLHQDINAVLEQCVGGK